MDQDKDNSGAADQQNNSVYKKLTMVKEEDPEEDSDETEVEYLVEVEILVSPTPLNVTNPLSVECPQMDPFEDDDEVVALLTPPLIAAPSNIGLSLDLLERSKKVLISHVDSPSKVWIQRSLPNHPPIYNIETVLQTTDTSSQLENLPIAGDAYAFYHTEWAKWVRVLVEEVTAPHAILVRLLDYGSTHVVNRDQ